MDNMQPGQIIVPHNADEPAQPGVGAPPEPNRPPLGEPDDPPPSVPGPVPTPEPSAASVAVAAMVEQSTPVPASPPSYAAEADWQYRPATPDYQQQPVQPEGLTWTASEFVAHEKNASWYGLLVAAGLVTAGADYLVTKDMVSTAVVLVAVAALAVLSSHKPRIKQYVLTVTGVQIGAKSYFFQDFKNFSIAEDGNAASIIFTPLKRFMPALTMYVTPDMEDQVIDFLSTILPFEQHKPDAVDALMRRIRF